MTNKLLKEMQEALASDDTKLFKYFDYLLQFDTSMFIYENVPEEMEEYWEDFEKYLCTSKCVAIGKIDGVLTFVRGGLGGGRLNSYGYSDEFIGATMNGKSIRWKVGEDCIVIWNNRNKTHDIDLLTTAMQLSDVDISIDDNILYSRFYPVPLVKDGRQKSQVESIFDNLKKGGKKTSVINKESDISEIVGGNGEQIPILNLTDVKNSDKIQYLTHCHDDIFRWFVTKYGQAVQGTGKQAQQSIEEIDGNTSVSFVYPLVKFEARKKGIDAVNKLFGTNIEVKFSPMWAVELSKYINDGNDADEMDEIEDSSNIDDISNEELTDRGEGDKNETDNE